MEATAGSKSHTLVKQENSPDTMGSPILTPEKGNDTVKVAVAADTLAMMKKDKEGPITLTSKNFTHEVAAEIVKKFFECPVCFDPPYQAAVTACGHIMCVACTQTAMNIAGSSVCPICRNLYDHLSRACELIGNLVRKLQPPEEMDPLLANCSLEDEKITEEPSVLLEDVNCVLCKELLYQPTVLNCGHVFCILCVHTGGEIIECPTCKSLHPSGPPKICKQLDQFIEDCFPDNYESKMEKTQSFPGTSLKREIMIHNELSLRHVGVGCDNCGIYPIEGDRYMCKSCDNFDLCQECAKIDSPIEGRFGQHHLPSHVIEINNTFIFSEVARVWKEHYMEGHYGEDDL